jgi:hypothetical protein
MTKKLIYLKNVEVNVSGLCAQKKYLFFISAALGLSTVYMVYKQLKANNAFVFVHSKVFFMKHKTRSANLGKNLLVLTFGQQLLAYKNQHRTRSCWEDLPRSLPCLNKESEQSFLFTIVSLCHRGGRIQKINAWYLNTHMVYL